MTNEDLLVTALEAAGQRITTPRRTVAGLISSRRGHFTAADLVADARESRLGIGRATIFRALDMFESLGAVERLDLPNGEHAYVACEPARHHHHVVCSRCGRTEEVDDPGFDGVVRSVGRRTGYRIDSHRLELFGLCPACASERTAAGGRPRPPR
jgi:Fur family ferric uptake transcriptional regulator